MADDELTEERLREAEAWARAIAHEWGAVDLRGTLAKSVLALIAEVRRLKKKE